MLCAIHQPNFFPWLGYFDKIRQADVFVLMNDVAYPKSGSGTGSWCNRVKVNIQGQPAWLGCPIRREPGVQIIKTVKIDNNQPWRKKLLRTLEMNYRKSPYYTETMHILEPLFLYETDHLAEFNINAIKALSLVLGLESQFLLQSEIQAEGAATALLLNLVKKTGADTYLCGGGADGYQEDALFQENGIGLVYQNFQPFTYGNETHYMPSLSVIDFLMHSKPEYFRSYLSSQESTNRISNPVV